MDEFYSKSNREQIERNYRDLLINKVNKVKVSQLLSKIAPLNELNTKIYKYAYHGLVRRLNVMEMCIKNVFETRPFYSKQLPTEKEHLDITINLQCFLIHLYGILENLAHIYAIAINFDGTKFEKSFFHSKKKLLKKLPDEIRHQFIGDGKWIRYVKNIRDLLAHQEPFYIPPYSIDMSKETEWKKLETKKQLLNNSYLEKLCEIADCDMQRNDKSYVPTIEELNNQIKRQNDLDYKLNQDIAEIERQQSAHTLFVPMLVTDTNDMAQPIMHFYPQMLVDMKTVYAKIIPVLQCLVE